METLVVEARAKVNLYLKVLRRRQDGLHEVRTVLHSVSLCDVVRLRVLPGADGGIKLYCSDEALDPGAGNLAYRAAALALEVAREMGAGPRGAGIEISLEKRVPVGAGLGGGSADAAAVLRGLDALLGLGLGPERLREHARRLGVDVAFCVEGGAALAEGAGDRITPLTPWEGLSTVIVKPGFSIATREAYRALGLGPGEVVPEGSPPADERRGVAGTCEALAARDLGSLSRSAYNSFEEVAFMNHPALRFIKSGLLSDGASVSLMSGSGSAIWAIFESHAAAVLSAERMRRHGFWSWAGTTSGRSD